jgi:hypothetical protein
LPKLLINFEPAFEMPPKSTAQIEIEGDFVRVVISRDSDGQMVSDLLFFRDPANPYSFRRVLRQ